MMKAAASLACALAFLSIPLHASAQEVLTTNVVVYLVHPYASTELAQGVVLPQTFTQLRDEADFLRIRYRVAGVEVLAVQPVRFAEPGVYSGHMQYRGKPLRLMLGWHRREDNRFWMELGLTYGERTLLRVASFTVSDRATFAVSGEVDMLGTEASLNDQGLLERRPVDKQVLVTLTPVWRTQRALDETPATLSVDPTELHADLYVTRERYYAATTPVDLSRTPILRDTRTGQTVSLGALPNVQSLLVEAFDGQPTIKVFRGRIRFSPNVHVLGIITDVDSIQTAFSALRASEPLFSSEKPAPGARLTRGALETSAPGSTAWDDFVRVEDNTVYFQLGITMGADDFRILLQYEVIALTTASFDVELEDTVIRGVRTSGGLTVGGQHLGDQYLFSGVRISGSP